MGVAARPIASQFGRVTLPFSPSYREPLRAHPEPSMARRKGDYTEILLRQKVISPEQLAEGKQMAKESGMKLPDALVRLGYATGEEVMRAVAEENGLDYVNLSEVVIPPAVIELVPESVARENAVIPLAEGDGRLTVIVSDPLEIDTLDKLRFILNRQIDIALAPREASSRRSTAIMGRRWAKAPTRCCKSSRTRRSTSPRRSTKVPSATRK